MPSPCCAVTFLFTESVGLSRRSWASSSSTCSSPHSGWPEDFYEKESHHRVPNDHRHNDPSGADLSPRNYRLGAGSVPRQSQRPDTSSQRRSDWLPHHRTALFLCEILPLTAVECR